MALSDHEKAVRSAIARTERESKLRAARFRVEQLQTQHEKARAEASKINDALKAAQLGLAAVEDQVKMAERDEKIARQAAPVSPPALQAGFVPPAPIADPLQETTK